MHKGQTVRNYELSDFSLEGKAVLVVGARRGMGKAFALGFAEAV